MTALCIVLRKLQARLICVMVGHNFQWHLQFRDRGHIESLECIHCHKKKTERRLYQ